MQFAVTVFAAAILLFQQFSDKYLRGFDAYYYALQGDWWHSTGDVRIPDSSFIHRVTGLLQFNGVDAETALRLWISISVLLFLLTVVLLLRKCTSKSLILLFFGFAMISPSILFIAVEFPKTFSFMIVFNLWFLFVEKDRVNILALIPLMFIAVLCHKIAIIFALIVFLAVLIPEIFKKTDFIKIRVPLLFLSLGVLVSLYFLFIKDHVNTADLARFNGMNLTPGIISLLFRPNLPLSIKIEFIAVFIAVVLLVISYKPGLKRFVLPILLLLTVFVPAFGKEVFNIGERFALLFPYLMFLSVYYVFKDAEFRALGRMLSVSIIALVLVAGVFRLYYSYPEKINPPYTDYDEIIETISGRNIRMLIIHRGMHFYYKYKTKGNAFSFEPEPFWDKTKIWRVVYGVTPEELYVYMPKQYDWGKDFVEILPVKPYTLIREDYYEKMRDNIKEEENEALYGLLWKNTMNPSQKRPVFLYDKHKNDEDTEFPALPPG